MFPWKPGPISRPSTFAKMTHKCLVPPSIRRSWTAMSASPRKFAHDQRERSLRCVDTSPIEVIDVDACDFPGRQRFFTFEGKDWYPINIDSGSTAKDAISVDAWTTLSEAPGSLADGPAAPSSSEVWAQARAGKSLKYSGHMCNAYCYQKTWTYSSAVSVFAPLRNWSCK